MSTPTAIAKHLRNGAERRRSKREPYVMEAWVSSPTSKSADDGIQAACVNLSKHGVAFELEKPLAVAAYFLMTIGLGPQRMIGEVRTISCRQNGAGRYEIGAEFV
jgi:hypothetical protein